MAFLPIGKSFSVILFTRDLTYHKNFFFIRTIGLKIKIIYSFFYFERNISVAYSLFLAHFWFEVVLYRDVI